MCRHAISAETSPFLNASASFRSAQASANEAATSGRGKFTSTAAQTSPEIMFNREFSSGASSSAARNSLACEPGSGMKLDGAKYAERPAPCQNNDRNTADGIASETLFSHCGYSPRTTKPNGSSEAGSQPGRERRLASLTNSLIAFWKADSLGSLPKPSSTRSASAVP